MEKDQTDDVNQLNESRPTKEQIASWATKFENLLKDKEGCKLFLQFLQEEYNEENLLFWLEVEDLKTLDLPSQASKAKTIYFNFIKPMSVNEVNITATARAKIEEKIQVDSLDANLFDSAQSQVYQMMLRQSYPRFLTSELLMVTINGINDECDCG